MMTPLDRHRMLVRMGLREPLPTVDEQRAWAHIDDRKPPACDPDGQFDSHLQWVHKASSWIGFTGAKCFDAKDRPCRNGGDMARARDEDAFPVRFFFPDKFPPPQKMRERSYKVLEAIAGAGEKPITIDGLREKTSLAVKAKDVRPLVEAGLVHANDDERFVVTPEGLEEFTEERARRQRAGYVRRVR